MPTSVIKSLYYVFNEADYTGLAEALKRHIHSYNDFGEEYVYFEGKQIEKMNKIETSVTWWWLLAYLVVKFMLIISRYLKWWTFQFGHMGAVLLHPGRLTLRNTGTW